MLIGPCCLDSLVLLWYDLLFFLGLCFVMVIFTLIKGPHRLLDLADEKLGAAWLSVGEGLDVARDGLGLIVELFVLPVVR